MHSGGDADGRPPRSSAAAGLGNRVLATGAGVNVSRREHRRNAGSASRARAGRGLEQAGLHPEGNDPRELDPGGLRSPRKSAAERS